MSNSVKFITVFFFVALCYSCSSIPDFPEGGYKYPASPFKGTKDSFNSSLYSHYWSLAFNELELNVAPLKQVTIRLIYETAFGESVTLIMTQKEIVIKQAIQGSPYPNYEIDKLDSLERFHLQILRSNFPIEEIKPDNPTKKRMDSLAGIYPKLLDPNYYKYLLDKSTNFDSIPFKYKTTKVPITNSKFHTLLEEINASGYWKLPPRVKCDSDGYLDGFGFMLEANTPQKYNFVSLSNCPEKALEFSKACQAIIDAANLSKRIRVIPEN